MQMATPKSCRGAPGLQDIREGVHSHGLQRLGRLLEGDGLRGTRKRAGRSFGDKPLYAVAMGAVLTRRVLLVD